ncbi:DUF2937 family protein [Alteromonas oceanisediminis]|uniref:DUF2937 family protein n=1 Tax=Alteromonas oceanisediminis TaxID=2836180 RepID=UPI001BDB15BE|nr:DUF2937 family protein [Alteromonas oceanisediminis]MBT0585098.1 DUF2937 family protein [Alteromonas oceanisediminis]
MISAAVERLIFGILLLACLQVPILSEHYLQYLSGYYAATQTQVKRFEALAAENNYPSVEALIVALERNTEAVVRNDAADKRRLLAEHAAIAADIERLKNGHYFNRLVFLASPSQYDRLADVLKNFRPGIPINVTDVALAAGVALSISLLLYQLFHPRHRKAGRQSVSD